jgi:DNA replication protein DnaC
MEKIEFKLAREERACERHGRYTAYRTPFAGAWTMCPACAEERDALEAGAKSERRVLSISELDEMNIAPMYYAASLDDFEAESEESRRNVTAVGLLCRAGRGKILMIGGNGAGKTHLACAALKAFGSGRIYTMFEIGVALRETNNGVNCERKILNALVNTPLLVIDEIGRSKGSEWETNWLSHVINKRHERYRPVILITDMEEGALMGNDVLSRFGEDGVVLRFTGGDYRERKRRARQAGRVTVS